MNKFFSEELFFFFGMADLPESWCIFLCLTDLVSCMSCCSRWQRVIDSKWNEFLDRDFKVDNKVSLAQALCILARKRQFKCLYRELFQEKTPIDWVRICGNMERDSMEQKWNCRAYFLKAALHGSFIHLLLLSVINKQLYDKTRRPNLLRQSKDYLTLFLRYPEHTKQLLMVSETLEPSQTFAAIMLCEKKPLHLQSAEFAWGTLIVFHE